jgi:hypothetical protein
VVGLSGAAAIYSLIAVVLTCCLAGIAIFSILGLLFDLLFVGASIVIAYYSRQGAYSCNGYVITPLGSGPVRLDGTGRNSIVRAVGYKEACVLNKVVFALSIITAVLFLVTAIMQVLIMMNHKKEKREKAARESSYDAGYATEKKPFWQRKRQPAAAPVDDYAAPPAAIPAAAPLAVPAPRQVRASRDTGYTGSTAGVPDNGAYLDKAERGDMAPDGTHTDAPLHNVVHPHPHGGSHTSTRQRRSFLTSTTTTPPPPPTREHTRCMWVRGWRNSPRERVFF